MKLLHSIKLLLPALMPSWNFFDYIGSSPRIQFTLLHSETETPNDWQEFRPRPIKISFSQMLKRMLWNPEWNESLYLVSCAERLMEKHTQHSENEILNRIEKELREKSQITNEKHLQFRLLFIHRQENELKKEIMFSSRLKNLSLNKTI